MPSDIHLIISNNLYDVSIIQLIFNGLTYGWPVLGHMVSILWLYQISVFLISGFCCLYTLETCLITEKKLMK